MKKFIFALTCIYSMLDAQEKPIGSIAGQLIDGTTNQPLVGANVVVIEQSTIGAITDNDGNFTIKNIAVGEYSVRATMVGYKNTILTNIVVSTGRSSKIKMRMNEEAVEVGGG